MAGEIAFYPGSGSLAHGRWAHNMVSAWTGHVDRCTPSMMNQFIRILMPGSLPLQERREEAHRQNRTY